MALLMDFEEIVQRDVALAGYTWFRVGGPAEYLAEPRSVDELVALVKRCRSEEIPVRLLGGGSNLLVRDEGVSGMVVHLSNPSFAEIETRESSVVAGGGARLGHVISTSVSAGLGGLENLVGIPGTIGGALHGNAGSHGSDIGQWTCRATVLTRSGDVHVRQREDLVFSYRQSSLDELVILGAEFELQPQDPDQLTKKMQKLWIVKKASQPMSHQSAGCVFKNPRGMNAATLIEQAGMKGTRIGGAEVNSQHANFIVTESDATAADVLRLIDLVRSRVEERTGVELETELDIW